MPDDILGLRTNYERIVDLTASWLDAFEKSAGCQLLWELFRQNEEIPRAVIQFPVPEDFFELFFNGAKGYRGMYSAGPWLGNAVNALLVTSLKRELKTRLAQKFHVWELVWGPHTRRYIELSRDHFLASLDPCLSKIWYSTAIVSEMGELTTLPSGISARRIDIGKGQSWAAIEQEPGEHFIEIKGAFVGSYGLFQPKSPETRGLSLFNAGET